MALLSINVRREFVRYTCVVEREDVKSEEEEVRKLVSYRQEVSHQTSANRVKHTTPTHAVQYCGTIRPSRERSHACTLGDNQNMAIVSELFGKRFEIIDAGWLLVQGLSDG